MGDVAHTSHFEYLARRRFGSLDGLRAIAVMGTVWHHTAAGSGLLGAGWLGVDLFFVISGFLITTLLLREWQARGRIDFRAFLIRRVLRIFPAYYLTVAVYALLAVTILSHTGNGQRFLELLPAFVTYTANWFYTPAPGVTLFVHGWSLSTEEQFYLLWPLLLGFALARKRPLIGAGLAVCLLAAVPLAAARTLDPSLLRTAMTSLSLPICGGTLLAVTLHSRRGHRLASVVLAFRFTAAIAAAGLLSSAALGAKFEILTAWLVLLVGACVGREDHLGRGLLAARPMVWLGTISYGVYLYHLIVVLLLWVAGAGLLPPAWFALVTLLVSAWMATVSHVFFERPFLRLKRRFERQPDTVPSPTPDNSPGGYPYASAS